MTFKRILFCLMGCAGLYAQECPIPNFECDSAIPLTRSDQVPLSHVSCAGDEYLAGYLQALVDIHYFEFRVRVVVKDRVAYLYNLPNNELLACSIASFVADVPAVCGVERVDCNPVCCNEPVVCNECNVVCENVACELPPCDVFYPCAEIDGIWFPQMTVLFAPLVADPRQVTYSGALRFNDRVVGKHVGAATFGDEFPIYRWKDVWCWHGDLQIGVEAGIFAVFDLDAGENSLVNTDYFVSLPLTYAYDCWSYRFRVWHMSCHIGDEFLITHPGFDRRNVSDEGTDLFVSYQWGRALRLYGGLGYILRRDKSFQKKPLYFEYGTEIRLFGMRECHSKLYMQPFLAQHVRNWEETNFEFDSTTCLGVEWSKLQGVGRKFRVFFEYHHGFSSEGQFVKWRCNYSAIRCSYGF